MEPTSFRERLQERIIAWTSREFFLLGFCAFYGAALCWRNESSELGSQLLQVGVIGYGAARTVQKVAVPRSTPKPATEPSSPAS